MKNELTNRLRKFLEERKISDSKAAKAMDLSAASLSQWFSGTYKGNNDAINEKVVNYLETELESESGSHRQAGFLMTGPAQIVFSVARKCHLNAKMGMIYGNSGLGKTTAAQEYAARHRDVIYLLANKSFTPKVLFRKLHTKLGFDGKGYVNEMLDDITAKLSGTKRFLIIDQAEYLNLNALHLLRTVFDEARVGILLIGLEELFFNVRGQRGELAQIFTRITIPMRLSKWSAKDVESYVKATIPEAASLSDEFAKLCDGNGYVLNNLIFNAREYAQVLDGHITAAIIKEAAKLQIS